MMKRESEIPPEIEEDVPPKTKIRLAVTVSKEVIEAAKDVFIRECKLAEERDFPAPDWSNVIEMLIKKGLKAYREEKGSARSSGPMRF